MSRSVKCIYVVSKEEKEGFARRRRGEKVEKNLDHSKISYFERYAWQLVPLAICISNAENAQNVFYEKEGQRNTIYCSLQLLVA